MFELLRSIFQIDWDIFMAGAQAWLNGQSPYERLASPTFGSFGPGAFAYQQELRYPGWRCLCRSVVPGITYGHCWS